jgi:hypothetical protein
VQEHHRRAVAAETHAQLDVVADVDPPFHEPGEDVTSGHLEAAPVARSSSVNGRLVSVAKSNSTMTTSARMATASSWTSSWRTVSDLVPIRVTVLRTHSRSPTR